MSDVTPIRGTIFFPEISGAEYLPDSDRLLLISDEFGLRIVDGAVEQLKAGKVLPRRTGFLGKTEQNCPLEDCEDAAFDGKEFLYVLTSHARNRRGKAEETRFRLGRLRVTDDAPGITEIRHSGALWKAIRQEFPALQEASDRTPAQCGLNLEGLAFDPAGELVIGLRSPTVTRSEKRESKMQEDAIVLRIGHPKDLFDPDHADKPAKLLDAAGDPSPLGPKARLLDLGAQGIRGLCFDRDRGGCWILSGLSADPNHEDVQYHWNLWFWDGAGGAPARARLAEALPPADGRTDLPDLPAAEAICLVPIEGRPHLLVIEDANVSPDLLVPGQDPDVVRLRDKHAGCGYVLLPVDALTLDGQPA